MSNLTQARMSRITKVNSIALPLAAVAVYQGGIACVDTSANKVTKGASGNGNLIPIGEFAEDADNTASGAPMVMVRLDEEVTLATYDSATGGNAVTAANLFEDVYLLDDHTVTTASSGNSVAGRVWKVDANGVAVQKPRT